MVFRTSGNESYPLNRAAMLIDNFKFMFFSHGKRTFYVILVVLAILLLLLLCFHRRNRHIWQNAFLFVMVGFYPYIWYMVLANHSQIHSYFTYRIQVITLFAIFICIIYLIDWERCKTFLDNKLFRRIQKW